MHVSIPFKRESISKVYSLACRCGKDSCVSIPFKRESREKESLRRQSVEVE